MSSEVSLLDKNQVFGIDSLDIFKKIGTAADFSDLAIMMGGYTEGDKRGMWWTKTNDDSDNWAISFDGSRIKINVENIDCGARVVLPYSSISSFSSNCKVGESGVMEIEYGEYPQTKVEESLSKELSDMHRQLKKTGKSYNIPYTDSKLSDEYDGFESYIRVRRYDEYEYNGKKYIAFVSKENRFYHDEHPYCGKFIDWFCVEPIKWLVDKKADVAVSEKLLFSGIPIQCNAMHSFSNFEETDMKIFMDKCFSKDIISLEKKVSNDIEVIDKEVINKEAIDKKEIDMPKERKSRLQKLNPDTTGPSERMKMTDTEIIHSWIEAGQSVLLRGPSGIGKTERIKSLYPDLIYIKLTNNMFPEKVVGSMNLQTGQSIPPDFAKHALLACATDEEKRLISENVQNLYNLADEIYERSKDSDKKVVILLDELLNVKPAVQSLVYTLVLNKLVETGKGLKLPANTVIVATGNQKKYSSVAEDLAEPLEKRFDHILDMQPKVGEWLNEYAIPNKIHPSVIGYILSKYIQNDRNEGISNIGYFYEEPEVGEEKLDRYGCKGRTNDPRGWVSISNTLYAFEEDLRKGKFIGKNVENILEVSIQSKLRIEWAREFFNFYNVPVLSVDEVVSDTFSEEDLPRDINERFACVSSLLLADENQVGKCREFIREYCNPEYLQLYDVCWAGNDDKKIMKIAELQDMAMINEESAGMRR